MHWLAASCLNLKISPAASVTCCFKIARTRLLLLATLVTVSESITGQTTTHYTWAEQYVNWTQTIRHRYEIVCISVHTSCTAYHSSPCNFKKNLRFVKSLLSALMVSAQIWKSFQQISAIAARPRNTTEWANNKPLPWLPWTWDHFQPKHRALLRSNNLKQLY